MRLNVTLQIASASLSPEDIENFIGYQGHTLTVKGESRVPPRPLPKMNLWSIGAEFTDMQSIDEAINLFFDRFSEVEKRLKFLRGASCDLRCTLYIAMIPFSDGFILFFSESVLSRISDISSCLSLEYFAE